MPSASPWREWNKMKIGEGWQNSKSSPGTVLCRCCSGTAYIYIGLSWWTHFRKKIISKLPHQFAMKLHESTWIYISEKFLVLDILTIIDPYWHMKSSDIIQKPKRSPSGRDIPMWISTGILWRSSVRSTRLRAIPIPMQITLPECWIDMRKLRITNIGNLLLLGDNIQQWEIASLTDHHTCSPFS